MTPHVPTLWWSNLALSEGEEDRLVRSDEGNIGSQGEVLGNPHQTGLLLIEESAFLSRDALIPSHQAIAAGEGGRREGGGWKHGISDIEIIMSTNMTTHVLTIKKGRVSC